MATWKIEDVRVVAPVSRVRTNTARVAMCVGLAGWSGWLVWRATQLSFHPVALAMLTLELASAAAAVIVCVGLERGRSRSGHRDSGDRRDPYRFANVVADSMERPRPVDAHREVRQLARDTRTTSRSDRRLGDAVMAAVLLDGPRRLAFVVTLTVALLVGVAPVPTPPPMAAVSVFVGVVGLAVAHVVLADGRLRLGDRTRWSFATLGEAVVPTDRDGVAPRRWVGMVATVVALNLAVALRGVSDRWTHGLPAMGNDERLVAMSLAIVVALGALYALRTTIAPDLGDTHLVSRRFEERAARRSTLVAAVVLGLVGLFAGAAPMGVDAAAPRSSIPAVVDRVTERVDGIAARVERTEVSERD